ncbi:DUF2924 domain-containing protein, partial [Enterovirga rhinocerotis]|uniref:DUF2924 domain-containing protein n=1 Tax=Enterovirga rhinocerotis TaxID=1339210 RepID=UPI001061654A
MMRSMQTNRAAAGNPAASSASLASQLQGLEQASVTDLRAEWRRLFGTDPPRFSRDLLVRAIAYGIQERMFGGMSRASLKQSDRSNRSRRSRSEPAARPSLRCGWRAADAEPCPEEGGALSLLCLPPSDDRRQDGSSGRTPARSRHRSH